MKYELVLTGKFKKGLKLAKKRGLNIKLLDDIVEKLLHGIPLEEKHRDHELKGKYKGFRECHIQPDWMRFQLSENVPMLICILYEPILGSYNQISGALMLLFIRSYFITSDKLYYAHINILKWLFDPGIMTLKAELLHSENQILTLPLYMAFLLDEM